MSYKYLEHSTDAFIEVKAKTLEEAYSVAGKSVVDTKIIAGIKFRIGNTIIDGSIATRLQKLEYSLYQ